MTERMVCVRIVRCGGGWHPGCHGQGDEGSANGLETTAVGPAHHPDRFGGASPTTALAVLPEDDHLGRAGRVAESRPSPVRRTVQSPSVKRSASPVATTGGRPGTGTWYTHALSASTSPALASHGPVRTDPRTQPFSALRGSRRGPASAASRRSPTRRLRGPSRRAPADTRGSRSRRTGVRHLSDPEVPSARHCEETSTWPRAARSTRSAASPGRGSCG